MTLDVMPAQAGIHDRERLVDARLHGHDRVGR